MLSYEVYKLVHVIGIIMIFVSLGGVMIHSFNGGTKVDNQWRKAAGITHGIGLVLVLVAGFGLLARVGIGWPWPGWVIGKLVIWIVLGGLSGLIYKLGTSGKGLWYIVILLGAIAASFAIFKPF